MRRRSLFLGGTAIALAATVTRRSAAAAYVEPNIIFSPLDSQVGIITPTKQTFVRDHAGIPTLGARRHRLIVHGLVRTPLAFSVADLEKFPAVTRTYVLECAGNSEGEWPGPSAPDVARASGLASCCTWTGARLRDVLAEVGMPNGCSRRAPIPRATTAAFRSCVPSTTHCSSTAKMVERWTQKTAARCGSSCPASKAARTSSGCDASSSDRYRGSRVRRRPNIRSCSRTGARAFDFITLVKSTIVAPSGGARLHARGPQTLRGFAWSGRGKIARVEISTDDGRTWRDAHLRAPILDRAFTAFDAPFAWDGRTLTVRSRATDAAGDVQPTHAALVAERGYFSSYHNNAILAWHIGADGTVTSGA